MLQIVRNAKSLGAALRNARRAQSLTQENLAKKTNLQQRTISQIENGVEGVRLSTMTDILRALDLELVIQRRSKGAPQDIEEMF